MKMLTSDEAKEIMQNSYEEVMVETSNKIREAALSGKDWVYVSVESHEISEKLELNLQELGYTVVPSGQKSLLVMW